MSEASTFEDQLLRRRLMGGDELLDQHPIERHDVGVRGPRFQPRQRRAVASARLTCGTSREMYPTYPDRAEGPLFMLSTLVLMLPALRCPRHGQAALRAARKSVGVGLATLRCSQTFFCHASTETAGSQMQRPPQGREGHKPTIDASQDGVPHGMTKREIRTG